MTPEIAYLMQLSVGLPLLVYGSYRVLEYVHDIDLRRRLWRYRREAIRQEQQSHPTERRDWRTRSMTWRSDE